MWMAFAIGSAIFASLTSILAKVGIDGVNSNLATCLYPAVHTVVRAVLMRLPGIFITVNPSHSRPSI